MKDIKVARQSLHDLKSEGRALLDVLQREGRLPTAAEEARLKQIERDAEQAAAEVAEIEREMDEIRNYPVDYSAPIITGNPYARPTYPSRPIRGPQYASLFANAPTVPTNGLKDFGEFLSIVHSGRHDPRLIQATAAGMGQEIGTEGGFLIPTEYVAQMLDASLENEVVRPRADVQPMSSNQKVIMGWDTENHTGGTIGGFSGQWLSEGTSATINTGTTRKITLQTNKLAVYCSASNELASGGTDFERQLSQAMVDAIGWHLDNALLNGTGAGQPRGVLNDPALITVAKETSQVADTILYENLTKMLARLHPALFSRSVWVANSNTVSELLNMNHLVKNVAETENVGGSHVPALSTDGSGNMTLLTRPLVLSEKMATLGDLFDIALCAFSEMTVGMRPEVGLQKSMHAGFQTDESHYRIILRTDGMGRWSGPVTPKTGSTLSWCVTLAARA